MLYFEMSSRPRRRDSENAVPARTLDQLKKPAQVTVHPSSILRIPDDEMRRTELGRFNRDLAKVVKKVQVLQ
jgi:hypothetical protein